MSEILHASKVIEKAYETFGVYGGERPLLIPTGIETLDRNMGGMLPGTLWFLGARTNCGKSSTMLNMGHTAAAAGHRVLFVSGEDPASLVGGKYQSRYSGVPTIDLCRDGHSFGGLKSIREASKKAQEIPLFMTFPENRSLPGIMNLLETSMKEIKPAAIFYDYLTTIRSNGSKNSPREFYTEVVAELREFAHRHKVPVLCGSQITRRQGETNDHYEISMRELSETGNIENFADVVMLMWRDDSGQRYLKIAKNKIAGHYLPRIRCFFDYKTEILTTEEII